MNSYDSAELVVADDNEQQAQKNEYPSYDLKRISAPDDPHWRAAVFLSFPKRIFKDTGSTKRK